MLFIVLDSIVPGVPGFYRYTSRALGNFLLVDELIRIENVYMTGEPYLQKPGTPGADGPSPSFSVS
jgi:hypothetical protein